MAFTEPNIYTHNTSFFAVILKIVKTWLKLIAPVGRDNAFPLGSVLKPEVGTLLRSLVG